MIWPTVMRGLSDEYGSWKITCTLRRIAFSSAGEAVAISTPSKWIVAGGWLLQPQDQTADGGLAAAGFADEPKRLAADRCRS